MTARREWNRKIKSWPSWIVLLVVVASVLAVGATRSADPLTQEERIDAVARRVACPVCNGESVFESRNRASRAIRNEITDLVRTTQASDDQIIAGLENTYGADVLLVPKASGFDALIWVLPTVVFVVGIAGLTVAFRRWKRQADAMAEPTEADRDLVAAALRDLDE